MSKIYQMNVKKLKLQRLFNYFLAREKFLFFTWAFWLCFEYVILGPFSYVRKGDNIDSFLPRTSAIWSYFSFSDVSYWHPLLAGGVDRLANEILYLTAYSLPFAIFPRWLAYAAIIFSGVFVGGLFVYYICRRIISFSRGSSIFAGMAFSSFLVPLEMMPTVIGFAVLPVAIYVLEKIITKESNYKELPRKIFFVIIAGFLFGLCSSLYLTLPFVLTAIVIWFIILRRVFDIRAISLLILFSATSIIVQLQEFFSLYFNVPFSQRGGGYYRDIGLENYLVLVYQRLSMYWLIILVILLGIVVLKIRNSFFLKMSILVAVLVFVAPAYLPVAQKIGGLGFLRDFGFDRFFWLIPFFASICAASVLNNIDGSMRIESKALNKSYILRVVLLFICVGLLVLGNLSLKMSHARIWITQGSYYANTHSPDLEWLVSVEHSNGADVFRLATITNVKIGLTPMMPNYYDMEIIDGHANVTSGRYPDFFRVLAKDRQIKSSFYLFWHASDDDKKKFTMDSGQFINTSLLSLANVKYVLSVLPMNADGFQLLDAPSSKNFYNWDNLDFTEKVFLRLNENFTGRKLLIYENENVLPRFFLTKKVRSFENKELLLNALDSAPLADLKEEVFLNREDMNGISIPMFLGNTMSADILKYSPDVIELQTKSDGPSILVITNTYNPLWKAYVNGKERKIFPTYHTFQGVVLESGENHVILRYEPPYSIDKG